MIHFSVVIKKFDNKGEKTGWTYIEIPENIANELKENTKVSFTVRGKLDDVPVKGISLLPMGGGNFIIPLKGDLRKKLHKGKGAVLQVQLEADDVAYEINKELVACLNDIPQAEVNFKKLPYSHQKYFSKWIESAKTIETQSKRISQAVEAMQYNLSYAEMIRKNKNDKML